ncbi:hypothetical protein Lepto7376_0122 [[Leptolyngbya] sp. PCC 7376]|uniref:hypothetical protein n=1 Tax=[Leptolyngbya] sp. PCC 7376 TaxID=111781 RepID=UPI00029F27DB|nr:hypothetical protein [[Leptolyngbya] sp. PCC 7376]AFY36570.1 hypothetical protein Lepto7376_0122 [[Leptolyngbya] sp. PCC 7376]
MNFSSTRSWDTSYFSIFLKSFLIWSFTLLVCLLVVGFPIVVLMMTVGSLMAIVLQSVLPVSAVLVVAGTIIGGTLMSIFLAAGMLTIKGVHPQEMSWLSWLHGKEVVASESVYAACPLTCELT